MSRDTPCTPGAGVAQHHGTVTTHFTRLLRSIRASAVVIALLTVVVTGTATTAFAHSGLGAASPAPGAVVGGEITEIQLRYAGTVADVEGSVTDPDGKVLESEWIQDGNLRVTVVLARPLSVAGEYAVRHVSTDLQDGDRVAAAYLFSYDPTAPPPQLEIIPDEGGFPWIWVVVGVGVVVISGLAWQLSGSLRRARNTQP